MYTQACVPRLFRYHAPWNLPKGLEIAVLPEDIEDMSQDAQKAARDDVAAKNMVIYYRAVVTRQAPYYYHVLTDPYNVLFANLALGASQPWGGMFHIVRTVHPCHRQSWMLTQYCSYDSNFLHFDLFGQNILPPLVLCTSLTTIYVLGAWRLNNGRIGKMSYTKPASLLVLIEKVGSQWKTSMQLMSGTRKRGKTGSMEVAQQETGRSVVLS